MFHFFTSIHKNMNLHKNLHQLLLMDNKIKPLSIFEKSFRVIARSCISGSYYSLDRVRRTAVIGKILASRLKGTQPRIR